MDRLYSSGGSLNWRCIGLGLMTESSMIRLQKNVMAKDKMKDLA